MSQDQIWERFTRLKITVPPCPWCSDSSLHIYYSDSVYDWAVHMNDSEWFKEICQHGVLVRCNELDCPGSDRPLSFRQWQRAPRNKSGLVPNICFYCKDKVDVTFDTLSNDLERQEVECSSGCFVMNHKTWLELITIPVLPTQDQKSEDWKEALQYLKTNLPEDAFLSIRGFSQKLSLHHAKLLVTQLQTTKGRG